MMKKIVFFCFACLCVLPVLTACKKGTQVKNDLAKADNAVVKIGISKIVSHLALDASEQGIQDAIKDAGINVSYDFQNANGDVNTAAQIATKFKNDKVNIAVGIATPVAVSLANAIKDIPVVFSSVTDPVGAGLVTSLEKGDGNVTGLSDAIPTREHIKMFKDIANLKTLGYIYTSNEANSISSLTIVESACKEFGLQLVTQSISTSAEVKQAADAIVNRVDGVYLTTDNTVFSALNAIIQVFSKAKKPIFAGDVTAAMNGGCMIASGFNYYKAGYATGEIVVALLNGKTPESIPVKFLTDLSESDLLFDLDAAANCGITIPDSYLANANYIFEKGNLTKK
ncbi:MAG: ABC transporter substrate-binding protein [Treponema sp.]|nr:ABC transporter substrate-binding protein [Treponema sp.]